MKRHYFFTLALLVVLAPAAQAQQQEVSDTDALAHQIVRTAQVKPGDAVMIQGGQHLIALMEAVALEASMRGGRTAMLLETDRFVKGYWTETPEEHLGQRAPAIDWLETTDVYIGLPEVEDYGIFDAIPEERFALASKAYEGMTEVLNRSKLRGIFVEYPTQANAERAGLDFATYEQMHQEALKADYALIARQAARLVELLKPGSTVRITTPVGTDFQFEIGNRPVFKRDGAISAEEAASEYVLARTEDLPSGQVLFAPVETSAEGTVKVPGVRCRDSFMREVSFTFEGGEMRGFTAAEGAECFEEAMAPWEGPKQRFGMVAIGLNPAFKVIEEGGAKDQPDFAAGMVYLGIGDNEFLGGANKNTGIFGFDLTGATVEIDGEVVVREGRLTLSPS